MIESIKNLVRDHWRARHTDIVGLREDLREIEQRLARLEGAVSELRRDLADQSARYQHLAERLERIEKRINVED